MRIEVNTIWTSSRDFGKHSLKIHTELYSGKRMIIIGRCSNLLSYFFVSDEPVRKHGRV